MSEIKPFSDNIIFFDTEFSSLNPYEGEIISVGMVKPNGEELYLELEFDASVCNDFVKKNVIPRLQGDPLSREEAKRKIKDFVSDSKPYMVAYINQFDDVYWHKLFAGEENPFYWVPVDFSSLLFFHNIDPEKYLKEQGKMLDIEIKDTNQHHALYDAKLLKESYYKLIEKLNNENN
jgi:hypothetical protein